MKQLLQKVLISMLILTKLAISDTTNLASDVISATDLENKETGDATVKMSFPAGILFGSFSRDDGPFLIEGSIIVPSGQILEFGPGCTILVGGEYSTITVFGQMIARGTAESPVMIMSAKSNPKPWDWDRLYCRSKNRSIFEHCIIRHSNYGIVIENGSASVRNCQFERNSLHGIVVKNGEVSLTKCSFTKGHAVAVHVLSGAHVTADSLVISENVSGIACHDTASFSLNGGTISGNANGIIASHKSSVSIIAAEITKNRNGLITTEELPRRNRDMIYGNSVDVKVVSREELERMIKEPQGVKSIVLPQSSNRTSSVKEGFTPGFSALSTPKETNASFIGNVTTGMSYFVPQSFRHPSQDTLISQTHYPEGIQPEIQLFASGRRGLVDVNLFADLYGNNWLAKQGYVGKNMFNLTLTYAQQSLVLGDFFESGSETSISGRQMTGLKYSGNFWEMGAGIKRVEFKLAAGETEIPKDSGDHEINIYNEIVDSGMSVRQQITYLASLSFKPSKNSTVSARGIIARDQVDKPLFRAPVNDPGAPEPIQAQSGCIDGNVVLLKGKLEFYAELDLGTHDTLRDDSAEEIAWYNPKVEKAIPEVFGMLNSSDFINNYALTIGSRISCQGYNFDVNMLQIAPSYFSAGNPYLESDRRAAGVSVEKQFREDLSGNAYMTLERLSLSNSPSDRNTFHVRGQYEAGENKPSLTVDYTMLYEKRDATERIYTQDTTFSSNYQDRALNNVIGLEGKQNFKNGIGLTLRYQFLFDNDISDHADKSLQNKGDRFQHQVNGLFSFKIKKVIRNRLNFRLAFKDENRDSLRAVSCRIGDQVLLTLIPRKLTFLVGGNYSFKEENEYSNENNEWKAPVFTSFYNCELEAKYSITSRISITAKGKYEKSYDQAEGSGENYRAKIGGLYLTYLF